MVKLVIKNLKEVDKDLHQSIKDKCEDVQSYFDELFKRYDKELMLEVLFDHSSALYKVSASLNLKSKKCF